MEAQQSQTSSTEFTNPNLEILYSAATIKERIEELGTKLTNDYEGKELVLVGVLKGSCVFLADLMRAIDLPLSRDFMSVSSYKMAPSRSGRRDPKRSSNPSGQACVDR